MITAHPITVDGQDVELTTDGSTNVLQFDNAGLQFNIDINDVAEVAGNNIVIVRNNINLDLLIFLTGMDANEENIRNLSLAYSAHNSITEDNVYDFWPKDYAIDLSNLFTTQNVRKNLKIEILQRNIETVLVEGKEVLDFGNSVDLDAAPALGSSYSIVEETEYNFLLVTSEPDIIEESVASEQNEENETSKTVEQVLQEVKKEQEKKLRTESTEALRELKEEHEGLNKQLAKFGGGKINPRTGYLELAISGRVGTVSKAGQQTTIENEEAFNALKSILLDEGFELASRKRTKKNEETGFGGGAYDFDEVQYYQLENKKNRYKAQLSIQSLEALKSFDRVASILLTEPYLYCKDKKSAKEELNRIQKAFSPNVLPIFYQNLELGILGENHVMNFSDKKYLENIAHGVKDYVNRTKLEDASWGEGFVQFVAGVTETAGGILLMKSIIGAIIGAPLAGMGLNTMYEGGLKIVNGYPHAVANISRVKEGIFNLSRYLEKKELHYSADEYIRVLKLFSFSDEKDAKKLSTNLNNLMQTNAKKFGDSKKIAGLINLLSNKYYAAYPCFKHFRSLAHDIGTGSKLEELLSNRAAKKTELSEPLNFYSKEISGSSLYDYLYFLLSFPYSWEGIPDESDFRDIFTKEKLETPAQFTSRGFFNQFYLVDKKIKWLAYNESIIDSAKSRVDDVNYETLLNIQCPQIRKWNSRPVGKFKTGTYYFYHEETGLRGNRNNSKSSLIASYDKVSFPYSREEIGEEFYNSFFLRRRESLKAIQKKKISYLLAVKKALLEQVMAANAEYFYESPQFRKYVENYSNASIFELMDDSAYPDIDLPKVDITFNKVKKMNPAFYYFNPEINATIDNSKTKKILNASTEFKKKVREGIVSSRPLDLSNKTSDEKEFLNKSQIINVSEISLDNTPVSGFPKGNSKTVAPSDTDTNKVKVDSKNELKTNAQVQVRLPDLKINTSAFKDEKELLGYIGSFETEVKAKQKEVTKLQRMFGNKKFGDLEKNIAGGIRKKGANEKIKDWLKSIGNNMQLGNDLKNYSSPETLLELHEKSYNDFFNQDGMKRAFPTFRLYLVEEDAMFSGKLTAYDDFYNYASVISFDVNIDRELAASTASIQLQNVSGILDGTKKEVLRDIDVDRREIDSANDDKYESLIESIVLRPGINVQLRAGYENDTKDLDILISGRITDISHGPDGMTTNIIVQSYGVELEQQVKSAKAAKEDKLQKYYTTHQLLGSLMLSPELKHFGRIKVGKMFQAGEEKEVSLDVKDYSNQSSFTLEYTTSFLAKLSENAHIVAIGVALLPPVFKYGGKLIGKFGFSRGIAAAVSRAGNLTSQFFGKYSNFGLSLLSQSRMVKFVGKNLSTINIFNRGGRVFGIGMEGGRRYTQAINSVLTNLKNGVELTAANQTFVQKIASSLSPAVKKSIDDLLGATAGTATTAAQSEAYLMAYVLRNEGMIFSGIKNFTYGALGNARTAIINANNAAILETLKAGSAWVAFGQRAGTYAANVVATPLAVLGSLGLLNALIDTINNGWDAIKNGASDLYEELFESKQDDTLKIMLSPQDDNLFPPAPSTYLVSKKNRGNYVAIGTHIANYFKSYANTIAFNVPYMIGGYMGWEAVKNKAYAKEKLEDLRKLFDTRLIIEDSENEYILKEQTIFKVFHEMSLRHPGYVYGARPYGRSMEYRMFFGLPNQNYWANDITTVDAIRLNKIVKDLSRKGTDNLLSIKSCKSLYKNAWEAFIDLNQKRRFYEKYLASNDHRSYERSKVYQRTDSLIRITENQIRKIITKHAMDEFLEKTKKRFVPFRKMHSLNSDKNIVSNNVTVSSHDVINNVTVYYSETYSNNSEGKYSLEMAANTAIKQHNLKQKAVHNPRIIGAGSAYRYGIGELLYGAKKLYTGSILTLGNTKINPWDVIILNDNVNRMYGPLEVKAVTHSFNHQSGFLTDIEVNALVAAGEDMLTYPAITSSVIAEAREKMYADFSSKIAFDNANADSEMYKRIIRRIITQKFPESDYGEDVTKDLEKYYIDELKKNVERARTNDEPVFLQDIISPNATLPESLKKRIEGVAAVGLGTTVGLGVAEAGIALTFGRPAGITNLRSPVGWGFAALTGLFSALYLSSDSTLKGIESSLNSGYLGKNLFRPILFSKVSNQNLIEVYPIVKDGKPMLTGGFENIPADQTYKNVIGNIFSMISDGYRGYLEVEAQINAGGAMSVVDWDDGDDFIEVKRGKAFQTFKGENRGKLAKEIYYWGGRDPKK